MEITYIGHSGFFIEWENCYWLFDYYRGSLPCMNSEKKLFVFVSHKHADHFNPDIFQLQENYPNICYILSSDIYLSQEKQIKFGITEEIAEKILSVKPSKEYELFDTDGEKIGVQTLKSTDCGVAFLLNYQGKIIYHAGDLNDWFWKEETKQINNNMTASFQRVINSLKDKTIEVAFAPLDPRQEEDYYRGLESLINTANVKRVFPMHFWDKPSIISQFKSERAANLKQTEVMEINQDGQRWKIDC